MIQDDFHHFLKQQLGRLRFEFTTKGNTDKGSITVLWPSDQLGNITTNQLMPKVRRFFQDSIGFDVAVTFQKKGVYKRIKATCPTKGANGGRHG